MLLLTILNLFLTREPRTTGFEGVPTEICLRQRADKTDRQTACMQDRVLGDVSWTRGQCRKHECRSQQADVHGFEPPARTRRVARWRRRTLSFPHRTRSPHAPTPRKADGTRPPDQRWASADLQHTNPGLACSPDKAQIEVPGSGKRIGKHVEP